MLTIKEKIDEEIEYAKKQIPEGYADSEWWNGYIYGLEKAKQLRKK